MATMRCRCATTLRDDDPDYGLLLFTRRGYDVGLDAVLLSWKCPADMEVADLRQTR